MSLSRAESYTGQEDHPCANAHMRNLNLLSLLTLCFRSLARQTALRNKTNSTKKEGAGLLYYLSSVPRFSVGVTLQLSRHTILPIDLHMCASAHTKQVPVV